MNYFLFKLSFDSACHFGPSQSAQSLSTSEDHVLADTLFSALCHTSRQLYGQDGIEKLCQWVKDGSLLLSDTMPWHEDDYFLPKPCVMSQSKKELPAGQAKAMKKMAWIPVRSMSAFSDSVHGGEPYQPEKAAVSFGFHTEANKVKAARLEGQDAEPYQVGLYRFAPDCGLYLIAAMETDAQEKMMKSLLYALGLSGLGGKTTSGCGRFHIEDAVLLNEYFDDQTQWLYEALTCKHGKNLLLSTSLPKESELEQAMEGALFQVARRGGFVASDTYSETPLKKKTQVFFKAGSVFANRFAGDLYSVGGSGNHPVFRYGKPLFLGVNI